MIVLNGISSFTIKIELFKLKHRFSSKVVRFGCQLLMKPLYTIRYTHTLLQTLGHIKLTGLHAYVTADTSLSQLNDMTNFALT